MAYFQTKNTNLGKFLQGLDMEEVGIFYLPFGVFYGHVVYFTAIWCILRPFGVFYCHLVYFMVIWDIYVMFIRYFFPVLVCCTKKSGNPGRPWGLF
jgi:hypothetical protein